MKWSDRQKLIQDLTNDLDKVRINQRENEIKQEMQDYMGLLIYLGGRNTIICYVGALFVLPLAFNKVPKVLIRYPMLIGLF